MTAIAAALSHSFINVIYYLYEIRWLFISPTTLRNLITVAAFLTARSSRYRYPASAISSHAIVIKQRMPARSLCAFDRCNYLLSRCSAKSIRSAGDHIFRDGEIFHVEYIFHTRRHRSQTVTPY